MLIGPLLVAHFGRCNPTASIGDGTGERPLANRSSAGFARASSHLAPDFGGLAVDREGFMGHGGLGGAAVPHDIEEEGKGLRPTRSGQGARQRVPQLSVARAAARSPVRFDGGFEPASAAAPSLSGLRNAATNATAAEPSIASSESNS